MDLNVKDVDTTNDYQSVAQVRNDLFDLFKPSRNRFEINVLN